jgi:uncharacterized protein (DUF58 family)
MFFGTILVLFHATPYSNLFFLLTAFLAVLGCLGCIGAATNLRAIDGELATAAPAPTGSAFDLPLRLRTHRRSWLGVSVMLELGSERHKVATTAVAVPGSTLPGRLAGLPRGIHPVTAIVYTSRHPFGICRATIRRPVAGLELVAHPVPAALEQSASGAALVDGELPLPTAGDQPVAGLRGYRPGDALRDVHWKASARRGDLVVKERDGSDGDGLVIVVDRRCTAGALETALSLVTALLLRAAAAKKALALRSQGHAGVYGPGHRSLDEGLRWLAQAQPLPATAAAPPPAGPTAMHLPRPQPPAAARAPATERAHA